ncbi:MAG: hypothetical protein AAF628_11400 [Planctomycetota bacterium]
MLGSSLWGNPELDEDPNLVWSMYLHTLREAVEDLALSELPAQQVAARQRELDPVAAFQLRQARVMQQNVLLERQIKVLGRAGRPLGDPKPAAAIATALRDLAKQTRPLEALLGAADAQLYGEHANVAADALDRMAKIQPDLEDAVDLFQRELRAASCSTCHRAHSDQLEEQFRRGMSARRRALDIPAGTLRVGYDVANAPGQDTTRTQAVADGFRTALLAVRALRAH